MLHCAQGQVQPGPGPQQMAQLGADKQEAFLGQQVQAEDLRQVQAAGVPSLQLLDCEALLPLLLSW